MRAVGVNCLVCSVLLLFLLLDNPRGSVREEDDDDDNDEATTTLAAEEEAVAIGVERAGPARSRTGAGNEWWWDRILLACRVTL